MVVKARKELSDLTKKVELELGTVIKERKELGLSIPQNYDVSITFYNSQKSKAEASACGSKSEMRINVLPSVKEFFNEHELADIIAIEKYFDITRDFLGNPHEEVIFCLLEHPILTLRYFEKSFGSEEALKAYKDFFKERGVEYDIYKKAAIKNAKKVRTLIKELLPNIKYKFRRIDMFSLRHEMDHIDFFSYPMHIEFRNILQESSDLSRKIQDGDVSASKECAQLNQKILKLMPEVETIVELRALFFSYVKPFGWSGADFEWVKKTIYGSYVYDYIENWLPEKILDKLVSVKWGSGEMDRQTSNYLFRVVTEQCDSPNQLRYIFKPEEVNYKVANQILFSELPYWKMRFADNAQIAVEAVGNAYRDEPSRLKETNKARTFNEFIEICKG